VSGNQEDFCQVKLGRLAPGHLFAGHGRYPEGTPDAPRGISGWPLTF
jgi:hypothetical protein